MRAYVPVKLTTGNLPPHSGYYLTNLGELYFDKDKVQFQIDKDSTVDVNIAVSNYYMVQELYTREELDQMYDRGYLDGLDAQKPVRSIIHIPEIS